MESKRKKRRVPKASSATPEQPASAKQPSNKPNSAEALIRYNGELIEQLLASEAWSEIVFPLIQEMIAGVSGRYDLNKGVYHHGSFTRDLSGHNSLFFTGYQKALMDFNNHIREFVSAKNRAIEEKKQEAQDKKAPFYNPFLEEHEHETEN